MSHGSQSQHCACVHQWDAAVSSPREVLIPQIYTRTCQRYTCAGLPLHCGMRCQNISAACIPFRCKSLTAFSWLMQSPSDDRFNYRKWHVLSHIGVVAAQAQCPLYHVVSKFCNMLGVRLYCCSGLQS